MGPFSESRNFRGWWSSKTSLEQKLVILSSVLFVLSFCLVITVIVLDNRKPACGGLTTAAPYTTEAPSNGSSTESPVTIEPPSNKSIEEPVENPAPPSNKSIEEAVDNPAPPSNKSIEEPVVNPAKSPQDGGDKEKGVENDDGGGDEKKEANAENKSRR